MSAALDRSGGFVQKYHLRDLTLGESVVIPPEVGRESQVRTAAANLGTRHGIWYQARKCPEGIRVTRVADAPSHTKKKWAKTAHREKTQAAQMKEMKDALRCLTVLVCEMKKTLAEIQETIEK